MSDTMNNTAVQDTAVAENTGLKLEARVRPITPKNNLLAFGSVKIADCFVVDNIKVVAGKDGLFVDMPSAQDASGKYHDVAYPITADFRQQITDTVLDAYSAAIEKMQEVGKAHEAARPSIKEQLREGAEKAATQTVAPPTADAPKRAAEAAL